MEDDVDKYYKELDPLHPDNFRSRGERAQRMKFPKDTTFRIIIPSSKGGKMGYFYHHGGLCRVFQTEVISSLQISF